MCAVWTLNREERAALLANLAACRQQQVLGLALAQFVEAGLFECQLWVSSRQSTSEPLSGGLQPKTVTQMSTRAQRKADSEIGKKLLFLSCLAPRENPAYRILDDLFR